MQKEEVTELLQSLSATAWLTGGRGQSTLRCFGEGSLLNRGRVGWLLSLSLGKVVGERGAETEGKDQSGASPSPSSR